MARVPPVCLPAFLASNSHRQAGVSTLPCLFTARVAMAAADRHVVLGVVLVAAAISKSVESLRWDL